MVLVYFTKAGPFFCCESVNSEHKMAREKITDTSIFSLNPVNKKSCANIPQENVVTLKFCF